MCAVANAAPTILYRKQQSNCRNAGINNFQFNLLLRNIPSILLPQPIAHSMSTKTSRGVTNTSKFKDC